MFILSRYLFCFLWILLALSRFLFYPDIRFCFAWIVRTIFICLCDYPDICFVLVIVLSGLSRHLFCFV